MSGEKIASPKLTWMKGDCIEIHQFAAYTKLISPC